MMEQIYHHLTQYVPSVIVVFLLLLVMALYLWSLMAEPLNKELCVSLGISETMDKHKSHGTVWIRAADGGMVKRYFLVDKPERLIKPRRYAIKDMFDQLIQMNYHPDTIEIHQPKQTLVYRYGQSRPMVLQH